MSGTRFPWGWTPKLAPEGRFASLRTFLRLLGLVYFVAFVSFGIQAQSLIGAHGILPFEDYLKAVKEALHGAAYWNVPTLLWMLPNDSAMLALWLTGCLWALIAVFGKWQRAAMVVCLVLWISLCSVGQDFYSFQWDILLCEAGFLAIFAERVRLRIWLFRWLLFRREAARPARFHLGDSSKVAICVGLLRRANRSDWMKFYNVQRKLDIVSQNEP